jgi:hypothetical protein
VNKVALFMNHNFALMNIALVNCDKSYFFGETFYLHLISRHPSIRQTAGSFSVERTVRLTCVLNSKQNPERTSLECAAFCVLRFYGVSLVEMPFEN